MKKIENYFILIFSYFLECVKKGKIEENLKFIKPLTIVYCQETSLTRRLDLCHPAAIHHLIVFNDAQSLMTRSVIKLSMNFKTK